MTMKHGLGRGLKALIRENDAPSPGASPNQAAARVPVDLLVRSSLQPRQDFPEDAMADLVRSVRERGVVQPLLVRRKGDRYEIIAGERRWRAAREAKLRDVPVILLDASDQDALELALIENLQREDLNAIEEAEGYRALADRFSLTQEQIADRVGKARASVANTLRLLELPDEVRDLLRRNELSQGHAKVLLGLEIAEERLLLARQALREDMSVRDLERLVEKQKRAPRHRRFSRDDIPPVHMGHLSDLVRRHLGTSVKIVSSRTYANGRKARGCMEIEFYSPDDLTRILELLGVTEGEGSP